MSYKHGHHKKKHNRHKHLDELTSDVEYVERKCKSLTPDEVIEVHGSSSEEGEISDSGQSSDFSESDHAKNDIEKKERILPLERDNDRSIKNNHIKSHPHHKRHRNDDGEHRKKCRHKEKARVEPHDSYVTNNEVRSSTKRRDRSPFLVDRVRIKEEPRPERERHSRLKEERSNRDSNVDSRIRPKEEKSRDEGVKRNFQARSEVRVAYRDNRTSDDRSRRKDDDRRQRYSRERTNINNGERIKSERQTRERSPIRSNAERDRVTQVKAERNSGERSANPPSRTNGTNRESPHPSTSRRRSADRDDYEWGKPNTSQPDTKKEAADKEKPDFKLSGKLTEDRNMFNGVVIKYSEPPEARMPKKRWRLYPFKGDEGLQTLYIHRQSAYLIGRDRKVADLPVHHPSCSKQHAALQYRLVTYERTDGTVGKQIRLYIIDLESANGTFVNNKKIEAKKYVELLERDVIKFGFSSREYVLLHEGSKGESDDEEG